MFNKMKRINIIIGSILIIYVLWFFLWFPVYLNTRIPATKYSSWILYGWVYSLDDEHLIKKLDNKMKRYWYWQDRLKFCTISEDGELVACPIDDF